MTMSDYETPNIVILYYSIILFVLFAVNTDCDKNRGDTQSWLRSSFGFFCANSAAAFFIVVPLWLESRGRGREKEIYVHHIPLKFWHFWSLFFRCLFSDAFRMKIIIIIICFSKLNRCVTNTKDIGSKGREVASEKLEGTQRPCPQPAVTRSLFHC